MLLFFSLQSCQLKSFLCKCSFIEIYNEQIYDLLDTASASLFLRENIKKGVFVEGAVEKFVSSATEAYQVRKAHSNEWFIDVKNVAMSTKITFISERFGKKTIYTSVKFNLVCTHFLVEQINLNFFPFGFENIQVLSMGWRNRRVASTSMNRESSRSHAVFSMTLESKETVNEVVNIRTSQLNLVDLAGSERQKDTHTEGSRLKVSSHTILCHTMSNCNGGFLCCQPTVSHSIASLPGSQQYQPLPYVPWTGDNGSGGCVQWQEPPHLLQGL